MVELSQQKRRGASFAVLLLAVVATPQVSHAQLFVQINEDPSFFPASAEIIAATPAQSTFGDDAPTSLGQSFTVTTGFSLESIFLAYENDTASTGDKTLTLSIFPVADVNAAVGYVDPPDPNSFLLSESVTFPYVGNTDTIAGIKLSTPLALSPGGYMLHFSGTTNPGWEWLRPLTSVGSTYADGRGYENGDEKDASGIDFSLALSSVPLDGPPIDTFSVQSGSLLAATTWDNGLAPVGVAPNPNYTHHVVNGHTVTADGSQTYNGAQLNVDDGALNYTASSVHLSSVTVAAGATVTETTNGEFFLGDISTQPLGRMELNGHLTITAESGDAAIDMTMAGSGTAEVNLDTGGTLFLTDMSEFGGLLQFNGVGNEVLYEGPAGGGMTVEMNSTGDNRFAMSLANNGAMNQIIVNESGEIDHRSTGVRLMNVGQITANANVTVDLTTTFDGDERRLFAPDGLGGSSNITVNGTASNPTDGGEVSLNRFENDNTTPEGNNVTHLPTDGFTGQLIANNFVDIEIRRQLSGGAIVVNQNAFLEVGHNEVEDFLTTRVGEITVNSGGTLEVGFEDLNGGVVAHVPYDVRLTTRRGQSGDLTLQAGSTTVMQISGVGAGQFDTITAEGTVTLGGELKVLIDPALAAGTTHATQGTYVPTDGDTFVIISGGAETLAADYDGNGTVGQEDYALWAETFGNDDFDVTADGNLDGVIDAADYTSWRDSLGASGSVTGSIMGDFSSMVIDDPTNLLAGFSVTRMVTPGLGGNVTLTINAIPLAAGSSQVPEPSSILLCGIVGVAASRLAGRRRRRT
ncbi:hypothetical protein Pla175_48700 [Pirellulimonas nuda]|uniref:Uncharacterized protein n=1 Tax=Pirellulimonas nuda TaxID=2528009 RepID=A0A518DJ35_9BACT|nr:PEP-CTERM sorting domain-containing protein [Pirellulimonas nuda]QDU91442.1 hypothetical protein Pla175_48700 [Pirellulimonas nuda]